MSLFARGSPARGSPPQEKKKSFRNLELAFYRKKRETQTLDEVKKLGYDRVDKALLYERRVHLSRVHKLLAVHVETMREGGLLFEHEFTKPKLGFSIVLARYGLQGREFIFVQDVRPDCEVYGKLLPTDELIAVDGDIIVDSAKFTAISRRIAESRRPLTLTFMHGIGRAEAFKAAASELQKKNKKPSGSSANCCKVEASDVVDPSALAEAEKRGREEDEEWSTRSPFMKRSPTAVSDECALDDLHPPPYAYAHGGESLDRSESREIRHENEAEDKPLAPSSSSSRDALMFFCAEYSCDFDAPKHEAPKPKYAPDLAPTVTPPRHDPEMSGAFASGLDSPASPPKYYARGAPDLLK